MKRITVSTAAVIVSAFAYGATIWHVSLDGDDGNGGMDCVR